MNIGTVALVTADRPALSERCLRALAVGIRDMPDRPRLLLVDGSRLEANQCQNRSAAALVGQTAGLNIVYCGATEASAWLRELGPAGSERVVLSRIGELRTTGSSRSMALLLSAGTPLLMVDDDVLPDTLTERQGGAAVRLGAHDDTRVWRFFSNRSDAKQSIRVGLSTLCAWHAEFLGEDTASLLTTRRLDDEGACAHLRGELEVPKPRRVLLTMSGVVGDTGRYCPYHLLLATGPLRAQLLSSPEDFDTALSSREVYRVAREVTLTHDFREYATYCTGIANTTLPPPFLPFCQNEDGVFARCLEFTDGTALMAHLDHGICHDSPRPSAYGDEALAATRQSRFSEIVMWLLTSLRGQDSATPRVDDLSRLGRRLVDLGKLNADACEEFITDVGIRIRIDVLRTFERQAEEAQYPGYWRDATRTYRRSVQRHAHEPGFYIPIEVSAEKAGPDALRAVSELFADCGELLMHWPVLWATAARVSGDWSSLR